MRNKRKKNGFTIIEIVVTVGILAVVAVVGTNIFFTVLRSSSKSKVLTTVKQNGDYALSVMERMIRKSEKIVLNSDDQTCVLGMTKFKIVNLDQQETEFEFVDMDGDLSNGYDYVASNASRLTSDEVKITNPTFDCTKDSDFIPSSITIKFTVSQNTVATPRPEEDASVDFQTTIVTRNY